jgi:hypothetical protein
MRKGKLQIRRISERVQPNITQQIAWDNRWIKGGTGESSRTQESASAGKRIKAVE